MILEWNCVKTILDSLRMYNLPFGHCEIKPDLLLFGHIEKGIIILKLQVYKHNNSVL